MQVRIAQGLVHLGKGLLTLNPYHSDRFLLAPLVTAMENPCSFTLSSGSCFIIYCLVFHCRTALAGLIITLHACLDMKAIILGKYHYVLYYLVLAMQVSVGCCSTLVEVSFILFCSILTFKYDVWQPRMLLTVDENLKPLSVPVRVGQAVDVVGQAGRPKTITGFQTHSTPVLLAAGDRAELATEKY